MHGIVRMSYIHDTPVTPTNGEGMVLPRARAGGGGGGWYRWGTAWALFMLLAWDAWDASVWGAWRPSIALGESVGTRDSGSRGRAAIA